MKTTIRLVALFVLVVAVFSQPTAAGAGGGTSNGHFKDLGADAYFVSRDPSGCIVTEVFLFATQHYFQSPPGMGLREPFVSLQIYQNDVCAGVLLLSASGGTTTNIDLQVDKKLNWARLTATVPVYEYFSQSSMDISIDLAWSAVAPATHETYHDHFTSQGCHLMIRSNSIFRLAQAWGSVSDGITNYTPETAASAETFSTKSGNLAVGCQ